MQKTTLALSFGMILLAGSLTACQNNPVTAEKAAEPAKTEAAKPAAAPAAKVPAAPAKPAAAPAAKAPAAATK